MITGSCPQVITGSCPQVITGSCPQVITGSCPQVITGSRIVSASHREPMPPGVALLLFAHLFVEDGLGLGGGGRGTVRGLRSPSGRGFGA